MSEYKDSGRPDNTNYGASDYDPTDYPTARHCVRCEMRCYEEDDSAFRCKADCGEWLCVECRDVSPICEGCDFDRAEAVAAEAARLESEIEKNKEALLRTMYL